MINCITQLLLNIWLNMVDYYEGFLAQYWAYILAEFWVFVIEAVIYTVIFVRAYCQKRQIMRVILYAFIANLASFAVGMFVMRIIENMSYQYEDLFVKTNGVKF